MTYKEKESTMLPQAINGFCVDPEVMIQRKE